MRNHEPTVINNFNGLYHRGEAYNCPPDHFSDCNNIKFSDRSFEMPRDGIGPHSPYKNVVRIYAFNQSLLVLDIDGNIYHTDRPPNSLSPILTGAGSDFSFAKYANRAFLASNKPVQVYTYGDAAGARNAAGFAPITAPGLAIGGAGNCEQGVHVLKVLYETDTGFLTGLSPGASVTLPDGTTAIDVTLPISPSPNVIKRHVVATLAIDPADFTGDVNSYQFFFIPNGTVNDNTSTTTTVNFYDAELLEDASHLDDLFDEIPPCDGLNFYHQRLIAWDFGGTGTKQSIVRVSNAGEPEAFNEIDGFITIPGDGTPVVYCQEQRDVLYIFKQTKTYAVTDNGDVPTSWPVQVIDQGIGTTRHGIGTIMDSGGVNVDMLLVADFTGVMVFSGTYQLPELTWKIRDSWPNVDRASFSRLQLIVESQNKFIYVVYPDGTMMVGDYNNGLNHKDIRWTPQTYGVKVTTVAILEEEIIRVIIGSKNT